MPLIPRHIFVHRGLLTKEYCESDDTLAFVLGHELGHCLLQHGERTAEFEAAVCLTLLVLLLAIDPTGSLSLGFEMFAPKMIDLMGRLPHSRSHEEEADALGMEISAKACYNPEAGATFFHTLARDEAAALAWLSTHPLPSSREERVHAASHDKAIVSYHDHCIDVTANLKKSLARHHHKAVASPLSSERVEYACTNETRDRRLDVYWAGYDGGLQLWTTLQPGETAKCAPLAGANFVVVQPDKHEVTAELQARIGSHKAGGVATTTAPIVHALGDVVEVFSSEDKRWHVAEVMGAEQGKRRWGEGGQWVEGKPAIYWVKIESGAELSGVHGSCIRRHQGFEGERRKECRTF
jgi:hypothetical protein